MKVQQKIQILAIALFSIVTSSAQNKPASPAAVAKGLIDGATITIKYSSPAVKERKIWGELVPYDKIWRAGANGATTIETDKDLVIEGAKLPAGTYSFFVIPNQNKSVLIFNKIAKQSGTREYKESEDQIRVTVKPNENHTFTESLTYVVDKNSIHLDWEKWSIPFAVKTK